LEIELSDEQDENNLKSQKELSLEKTKEKEQPNEEEIEISKEGKELPSDDKVEPINKEVKPQQPTNIQNMEK